MTETKRAGDWIQTHSGICFWPLDPRPEEIDIGDIAHALSLQCRFGGHCDLFYSVAQHSVYVSREVPEEYALWGLLHDAAEAYLVDLPRPLKRFCEMGRLYIEIEDRLMLAVCERFELPPVQPKAVKVADTVMLMTEKRDLMSAIGKPWEDVAEPVTWRIEPWTPQEAERAFLERFDMLK
jgi:uncharacterized protein